MEWSSSQRDMTHYGWGQRAPAGTSCVNTRGIPTTVIIGEFRAVERLMLCVVMPCGDCFPKKGRYTLHHAQHIHIHRVDQTLSDAAPIDGRRECHTRNSMKMENKKKANALRTKLSETPHPGDAVFLLVGLSSSYHVDAITPLLCVQNTGPLAPHRQTRHLKVVTDINR